MGVYHIDNHVDDPDVVVRVHEGKMVAPFATLSINEITFYFPVTTDVGGQLEAIAKVADKIQAAVLKAVAGMRDQVPAA